MSVIPTTYTVSILYDALKITNMTCANKRWWPLASPFKQLLIIGLYNKILLGVLKRWADVERKESNLEFEQRWYGCDIVANSTLLVGSFTAELHERYDMYIKAPTTHFII
ncbi:11870_t:CDS:2 [Rhizophagus irregularis]|nr:11870_t:CDS:2 [Rhizophagus irregularis]